MISQIIDQLALYLFYQNPFERILYEQIDNHTKDILSKYQRVFRKNLSSQHSLLALFEKWEKVLDNGRSWGALLIFQKL